MGGPETPPDRTLRDLVFAEPVGFRPLALDLHRPAAPGAPLVVFVHGGGWRLGSRRMFVPTMRDEDPFARVTATGLAIASVDYRLSGEAVFPAQVDDVAAALGWLRVEADRLEVDASRVVLWGESAGATIAALVALQGHADVVGVIDWYGPADLPRLAADLGNADDPATREAGWIGGALADLPGVARRASPALGALDGAPPFLLAHGLADEAVPADQSVAFAEALRAAGGEAELELVPGAGHMWQGDDVDRRGLLDRAIAFARRML